MASLSDITEKLMKDFGWDRFPVLVSYVSLVIIIIYYFYYFDVLALLIKKCKYCKCYKSSPLLPPLVCKCRALTIYGFEGQDVTLPCKYDSRYHGICDICWMRGNIPNNGCGNQIIYANDKAVVSQDNMRYQLNGALQKGEASLTILSARKSDAGKYGCRVHVPGWFNDKKIVVYLEIREGKYSLR